MNKENTPDPKDAVAVRAATKPKALEVMAARLNVEPGKMLATLRDTVFRGANESELLMLVVIANEYQLNPLLREIYAFKRKDGDGIQAVVSVDGWIKVVNRHPKFDGVEDEMTFSEDGKPYSCKTTMWVKNRKRPVVKTEYFEECYRKTAQWDGMPRRMLGHKSYIQCARRAFGITGILDEDEARDAIEIEVEKIPDFKPKAAELPESPKGQETPAKLSPIDSLRSKIEAHHVKERDFCTSLQLIGFDTGDVFELEELSAPLLKQLDSMEFAKILTEMENAAISKHLPLR